MPRHPHELTPIVALLALVSACGSPGERPVRSSGHPFLSGLAASARAEAAAAPARVTVLGPEASPVSMERMTRFPEPGLQVPQSIAHSPDGKLVTFLQKEAPGSDRMALFSFDVATRKIELLVRAGDVRASAKPLSREEELRLERQRKRIQGVTAYRWAKRAPVMILPMQGDIFLRGEDGKIAALTQTEAPEIDPKICDGGERVAFVRGGELVVIDVASRRETKLTQGAPDGVTRGLSDFNGQEEFGEESGFWLSPRCDRIAYLEVDERDVKTHPVLGFRGGKPDLMVQKYPSAGEVNPRVKVGVIDVATRKTTWINAPQAGYVGRFVWSSDGRALWMQALSRDQKRLALVRADPTSGAVAEVIVETSPTWIELAEMALLERSPQLLWTTVTGGHQHVELRDAATGARVAALTSGSWDVEAIEGVDEAGGRVFLRATKEGPLERHVYSVALSASGAATAEPRHGASLGSAERAPSPARTAKAGQEPGSTLTRLTKEPGVHRVTPSRDARVFVDAHSATDRLPKAVIRDKDGVVIGELPVGVDADMDSLRLRPVELVTIPRPGGEPLHGALLRPRTIEPGRRHPVVVVVYGGPGHQTVVNQWAPRLLWQHLADRGFVVFQLDNRGTSGRGPAFEGAIHRRLGVAELEDQLAGVDYLATLPFVDKDRVGIYGHSYGGFMAALAMLKAPGRFRAGIAASPVTDWRLYDTGYTERFMETPSSNPEGYAGADLGALAPNLAGKLLIIHAMMDENVHFQNTAHLIDALVAANKDFDLLVFPGERHGYRSPPAKLYATRRIIDYFVQNL